MINIGESVDLLSCPREIGAYTNLIERIARVYLDLGIYLDVSANPRRELQSHINDCGTSVLFLYLDPISNDAHSTFVFNEGFVIEKMMSSNDYSI